MKHSMHPQDIQWLRRQLRINFRCVICIVLLLLIIRYQPPAAITSTQASTPNVAMQSDDQLDVEPADLTPLPEEEQISTTSERRPNPIPPTGWRRTSRGWEHASSWPNQVSINDVVADQQSNEPAWIQRVFAKLRGIPPLMIGLLQITGIAVIIGIAHDRRKNA